MKRIVLVVAGVLTLAAVNLAKAQFGMMRPPEVRGVFNPVVGSGASYEMIDKDKKKSQFDIAIVEKDPSGGYWMEYSIVSPEAKGTVHMKTLIARQGNDAIMQRMIFQTPGQPPMEFSQTMRAMQGQHSGKASEGQKLDYRAEAENLGTEPVTTPAGIFACQHWRTTKEHTDIWLNDKVTPWGLVKMSGPEGSFTLQRIITNAKSQITGTPVSMEEMLRQEMGR